MKKIGIRHEDKYLMERRCALTPSLVKKLLAEESSIGFLVEESAKRIFTAKEFESTGARIVSDVKDCDLVFGVKEIHPDCFQEGKTYVFFSHVIKGQSYNMPMLKKLMEKGCNLIDYEKVEDESGKRLIFFGKFAGLAGMINSLWSLGQRFKELGHQTPFEKIKQAYTYDSLDAIKDVISEVGFEIAKNGLPKELSPVVVGFTGYGNVSIGAQEIYSLLPVKEISPAELLLLQEKNDLPSNVLYKVVFKEKDLVVPNNTSAEFELQDYYNNPGNYSNDFEKYVPNLTVLMNCMYWDARYPRIVTKDFLEKLYKSEEHPKLVVIGDVTCDPDGSIEATHKGTEIEDPVFVYNPFTRQHHMGFKGEGVLIMAVDILPSELPREASMTFSEALSPFVVPIALTDFNCSYEQIQLPNPIKRALIVHQGKLTPPFKYIEKYL